MTVKKMRFAFLFIPILFNTISFSQTKLPRSNPEAEGVSSGGIIKFLDAVAGTNNEMHSLMILRHGKVIAEGWWTPYRADLKHTMYSVSKSFTATAVGLAIAEKKLSVDDKIVSFFPNQLPDTVSNYLSALTVKDLLSMSVGQTPDPTGLAVTAERPWSATFLSLPIADKPGTKFLYNSLGSYMLSAIVQKVTGQKVIDYLRPRLFTPLGIQGMDWEVDPEGINTGGWGLRVKTEDMAKFGQLFLNKGRWKGKQILPASWIEEATTMKIDQAPDMPQAKKDSSDWMQGYCYQMWRCRHNGYRADGAFGQYIIVMPELDAVIVITSETPNMQNEINLVWEHILPAFHQNKLVPGKDFVALKKKLASLRLPAPRKKASPWEKTISGKTYVLETNNAKMKDITFKFVDNSCYTTITTDTAVHHFAFGAGYWREGTTTKKGPSLVGRARAHFSGLPAPKVDCSYTWKDDQTLELQLRYIESPHTEKISCRFEKSMVSMDVSNSFDSNPANKAPTLKGSYEEK
jgi:CubicO group peptidase (beta-lactamase class C family)